ncbi:MAG: carbon-nitrogen hydrolase family protein [Bdellovibrionia bacterium]
MSKIKVAAAQYPIGQFESFELWQRHISNWVESASVAGAKIVLFPEYASMELVSVLLVQKQLSSVDSLQDQVLALNQLLPQVKACFVELAQKYQVVLVAPSMPVVDPRYALPVNRVFVYSPQGELGYQDKFHMTRFENESWKIGRGDEECRVFEYFGVSFAVSICFDVEFAFFPQLAAKKGAQILLAPSCTDSLRGMNRVHVGARARALENQLYVVVSQTVGDAPWSEAVDMNKGYAAFYSTCDLCFPEDGVLSLGPAHQAQWLFSELDLSLLQEVRERGQVFNFKENSQYTWNK